VKVQCKGINMATKRVPYYDLGLTLIAVTPITPHPDMRLIWRMGT
jgi:hypothetical protein